MRVILATYYDLIRKVFLNILWALRGLDADTLHIKIVLVLFSVHKVYGKYFMTEFIYSGPVELRIVSDLGQFRFFHQYRSSFT